MKLVDIIHDSAKMLGLNDVVMEIENCLTSQETATLSKEVKKLITCANLVLREIAEEYVSIKKIERFKVENGILLFDSFASTPLKIYSVKDDFGHIVKFELMENGVKINADLVEIIYSVSHDEIGFDGIVTPVIANLSTRVLSYGVCSEYMLQTLVFDLASLWSKRFKDSLKNVIKKQAELIMPERRWF